MIKGYLEDVREGQLIGWVCDMRDPERDLFVEIRVGMAVPYTTLRANLFRADLQAAGYGSGHCGFRFDLPEALQEQAHQICVRVAGTDQDLPALSDPASSLAEKARKMLAQRLNTLRPRATSVDHLHRPCRFSAWIIAIKGARIDIATDASPEQARPALAVGGTMAWLSAETDFLAETEFGQHYYRFYLSGLPEGAHLELFLITEAGAFLQERRPVQTPALQLSPLAQLARAARIARDPEAVAIVCWGAIGAHVVRAAALQRALQPHRPCLLVLMQDDCAQALSVEAKLLARDAAAVILPWSDRLLWFDLFREMGIAFDTLWICGTHPRAYTLAGALSHATGTRLLHDIADQPRSEDPDRIESEGMQRLLDTQVLLHTAATSSEAHPQNTRLVVPEHDDAQQSILAVQQMPLPSHEDEPLVAIARAERWMNAADAARPALLLVWKQHDSAMYGRRVDQIARSYRAAYPDHRVYILEVSGSDTDTPYKAALPYVSELTAIRHLNTFKQHGTVPDADGIQHWQLYLGAPEQIHATLLRFLIAHKLLPNNTVITLFPNIMHLERVFDLLAPYPIVADIVDNQLAWAREENKLTLMGQLFAVLSIADEAVFNSAENMAYFAKADLITGKPPVLIPNWYQLPSGMHFGETTPTQKFELVYSGNMNERVDWELLNECVDLDPNLRLHLIGDARLARDDLAELLSHERVLYYGPRSEAQTLELLAIADMAIIPHLHDDVSTFMNPIKVLMYRAMGLRVLTTNIPGLEAGTDITIAKDRAAFLGHIRTTLSAPRMPRSALKAPRMTPEHPYMRAIGRALSSPVRKTRDPGTQRGYYGKRL